MSESLIASRSTRMVVAAVIVALCGLPAYFVGWAYLAGLFGGIVWFAVLQWVNE